MDKVLIYHNGEVYEIPQEAIYIPFVDPAPVTEADDNARLAGWVSGEGYA